MPSDRRSHPTVRPHALALGVIARPGAEARLAFLGSTLAEEVANAMLLDALGALSTFPVRHRVVLLDESDEAAARLPTTWKRQGLPSGGEPLGRRALTHLFALGGEASLLVIADGPILPLGELFDGLLGLAQPRSTKAGEAAPPPVLVGPVDGGEIFALGMVGENRTLTDALDWEGLSMAALESAGAEGRVELRRTSPTYVVDGPAGLRRLKIDVMAGAFAPACRKVLDRSDVERALVAAGV